jgi:site-specific recombinase XerD
MSRSSTTANSPVESLLDGFVGYLREERGVSAATVETYVPDVRRFLAQHGQRGIGDLTAAAVSKAVLAEVAGWSPASVRRYAVGLRSFLRYCQLTGLIETDLSASVLPVSGRRRSLLPQGISPAQARALLRSCDRRRAAGRRDYAVIVMMLRLGLRAGEVAALRLEDIDWRAGLFTVHGKRARVDHLPLPVDVGEAIAGYLQRGRPLTATQEVFVQVIGPRVGLGSRGVSTIVRRVHPRRAGAVRLAPAAAHRGLRDAARRWFLERDRSGASAPLARQHRSDHKHGLRHQANRWPTAMRMSRATRFRCPDTAHCRGHHCDLRTRLRSRRCASAVALAAFSCNRRAVPGLDGARTQRTRRRPLRPMTLSAESLVAGTVGFSTWGASSAIHGATVSRPRDLVRRYSVRPPETAWTNAAMTSPALDSGCTWPLTGASVASSWPTGMRSPNAKIPSSTLR